MALFTRNEKQQALQQETGPRTNVFRSLGLDALFQLLQPEEKYRFIDLGPAIGRNVEYLTQYASRIRVLDLHGTLAEEKFFDRGEEPCDETMMERALKIPDPERFDVVLGWDLFNYLKSDELRALVRYLDRHFVRGTIFFAMVSTLKEMPAQPMSFRIQDKDTLIYCADSAGARSCPRFTPRDLTLLMSSFSVHSSFILRNGMQEYVFVHR